MKNVKILRILAIAVVLALLLLMVPVLPALAVNDIVLSPTQGNIGQTVSISGNNFNLYKSNFTTYEYDAEIYFAEENVSINFSIDTNVKTYKLMLETSIDETGHFSTTFNVPSQLNDYPSATYHDDVRSGTYHVYITINKYYYDGVTPDEISKVIRSSATFTVVNPTLNPLSTTSGPAGTQVTVSGVNFPAGSITITFDGTSLPLTGSTQTSGGSFASVITIPADASPGAHTITVIVGSTSVSATFTVTASASINLSTASGQPGDDIVISGSGFPANTALVFKFDTTTVTASGHLSTQPNGSFLSTITVPSNASDGAHTITVSAGTATATATYTVTATATLNPLSPASGPAGTDVTISGTNFMVSYPIIFKLDSATLTPKSGDTSTTTGGSFNSIVTIPAGTAAGAHTISVTIGTVTLTATFTVTGAPTPTPSNAILAVATSGNNIGAQIAINGAGFTPGATVTFKYDNTVVVTTNADNYGMVSESFNAPPSVHGEHIITVSDGTNTATTTFTVESTPPPVPTAVTPGNGAKVKTPITFDWQDVTDTSMPVTYDLQIATDDTFAASSIVLEKAGLNTSEFILSDAEELTAGEDVPYYWRVRAVDAAQNESAWNTTYDFYSSGPSSFPTWALVVIGIVGGLFLLLAGYWLGRRTAFYY
jgi:hypothetical protein